MRYPRSLLLSGIFFGLLLFIGVSPVSAITSGVNFNSTSDLTDNFNSDGSPVFTNQAASGINGTGSVNVPTPSNDLWTTKQSYSVSGGAGNIYRFSAYFKVAMNSGYGNLGFTSASSNTPDGIGQPPIGLGANFHGGGGAFVNNGVQTSLSWPPDLVLGNWYWMMFEVTTKGSNTFDLKLQIWNTDATGTIGTMKTEKTQNNVVNNQMGSASIIHGFFSAAGSRMNVIDNFQIELQGATFVEEGEPVVLSDSAVTDIEATTATFGGNVTSDNGSAVTVRGVCWSTASNPVTSGTCTTNGTGTGVFSSNLTGLTPNTLYYVRAYATNVIGTSYGSEVTFTTDVGPAFDTDGLDNTVEGNGPNGGDVDDDGTADNLQSEVGTKLSETSSKYVALKSGVGCTTIGNITMRNETDLVADPNYTYPDGLMDFNLTGCTPGATVVITQYYYGVIERQNLVVRKFNPNTNTFSTIDSATIQIVDIAGQPVVMVQYSIQDGGALDMDGVADGAISDPAGLGLSVSLLADTGFDSRIILISLTLLLVSLFGTARFSRFSRFA